MALGPATWGTSVLLTTVAGTRATALEVCVADCKCGCGMPTPVARKTVTRLGHKKGEPVTFVHGHHRRGHFGPSSTNWRGGTWRSGEYLKTTCRGHPRADGSGGVFDHVLVAERALSRYLTPDEIVHHVNRDTMDNRPENLMVMTRKDHTELHRADRAQSACGRRHWRKCDVCGEYGDPAQMRATDRGTKTRYAHKSHAMVRP